MIVCPACGFSGTRVADGRPFSEGRYKRKRVCKSCSEAFWTLETVFTPEPCTDEVKQPPRTLKKRGKTYSAKTGKRILKPRTPDFENMTDEEIEEYFYRSS